MVRHRPRALRRDDHRCCATTACSSATATRSPRSASRCCCCRACRGIGQQVNGAYLGVKLGPLSFQPAEFAKIGIIVFLASYLRDTRQLLVIGARRVAGITIPPLKHFGPLLVVWGAAMLMLFVIQDLGSSLMFFGGFLALLYVATEPLLVRRRSAWCSSRPAHGCSTTVAPDDHRAASTRGCIRSAPLYDRAGGSYQIAQSLFAQADGGLFGRGFGQALLDGPATRRLACRCPRRRPTSSTR